MGKLYQCLKQYGDEDYYPYHMPGHKRKLMGEMPREIMEIDITEIDGFDNLHQSEGILLELQERAARLYGAEESFYLVNGSTCGILSAISAALPQGGHLLMARNSHKSAYHVAYLRNLTVSYLYPQVNQEYDICDAITPKQVKEALEAESDIGAVFIVSPTYEGRIADIEAIAQIVHDKGLPLIVDEAHGAHLGLVSAEELQKRVRTVSVDSVEEKPYVVKYHPNSCQAGADIVIHSVHKTLPAMTQTALLHVSGNRIDREKLRRFLHIYQSSSPSYVLMASIDNALQLIEEKGKELFPVFWQNYTDMLEKLSACKHLRFLPLDEKQDIGKLVISTKQIGLSGQQIYDILLQKYHLQLEMASGSYCLAMFTVGDTAEAYERMTQALLAIDGEIAERKILPEKLDSAWAYQEAAVMNCEMDSFMVKEQSTYQLCESEALPLAKAWDMIGEEVSLEAAIGRNLAEFVNLYPPGVPLLVPGEVLQKQQYQQIIRYIEQGLTVQGVSQEAPYLVKVLKRKQQAE